MQARTDGHGASEAREPGSPAYTYTAEMVTPALAQRLLGLRRARSERNPGVTAVYANDMRAGAWILNGAPIVVSRTSVLLDGVQRLMACVDADVAFPSFVARGVNDTVAHTIDQHRKRTLSGTLGLEGVHHARAQMAVAGLLLRYAEWTAGWSAAQPSPPDVIVRAVRANPEIEAAVVASLRMRDSPLPEPVRAAILFMGRKVDAAKTDRLLRALAHPEALSPGEPAAMLRVELDHAAEAAPLAVSRTVLLALTIKALNAQVAGTALARLHWAEQAVGTTPAEAFPRLVGYPGLALPAPPKPATPDFDAVVVTHEAIDVARARQYLALNIADRGFIKTHVAALARDMAAGRWLANAQPICLSASGRLMNGQHRLLAVVAARSVITVPVLRGLPDAAFGTYDTQARRAPAVEEGTAAFGDQALAAAMAQLLWQNERRGPFTRGKKATAAELRQILADFPRLLALRGFARRMLAFGRASVMGYGAFVIERDNPAIGERFLKALETGANLPEGDSVLALRETLRGLRQRQAPPDQQLAALLGGWERYKARHDRSAPPAAAGGAPRPASPAAPAPLPRPAMDPPGPAATLRRRGRQQALAAGFGSLALRGGPPEALVQEAARLASEGLEAPAATIHWHDPASGMLRLRAGVGLAEGARASHDLPVGPGSPAGEVFARGSLRTAPGPAAEAGLTDHPAGRQIHVMIGGLGVLGAEGIARSGDGDADVHYLKTLANTLALAMALALAQAGQGR